MCEWRIFLPKLLPSDSKWISDSEVQQQYATALTDLKQALNKRFQSEGNDSKEERTDRYYVGTDEIGLKHRAGKKLEVKVRDSVSQVLMGGETWSKFKLKKDPTGAAKFQDDIDHSTDRHELVDVIKNRRRDEDTGSPVRYEKTTVKLEFPRTDPVNGLTGSYYSGRSWVTICLEGVDSRVLQELSGVAPNSALSLLRKCLALCLRIRYDSIANSCLESFFPVLAGYPTFLRVITRPASALLPIYTAPLLNLLHTLPVSDEIDLKFLPSSVFSQYASSHPLICSHIVPISDDGIDARVVPYVPQDVTSPVDVVDPIRARRGGTLLNLDRVLLHSPHFAQGWNSLFGELRGDNMSISAKSKELAICVVAVLNEAEYEFFQHQEPWVAAGASEEQVLALRQLGGGCHESFLQARQAKTPLLSWSCFDSMELDIIQLTVEMTKNVKTTPELMARLKETLGGNAALVEITGVIAGYNMVSRFLVAMDITALNEGGI